MKQQINIYTDGSSKGNPGKGGFGFILEHVKTGYRKEFAQGYRLTTNNRMELMAVTEALKKLKFSCEIKIYSDSKYVVDSINKKWIFNWAKENFSKAKNPDLWKIFIKEYTKHSIQMIWIKGHNQHPENERCDLLANQAAASDNLLIDTYFENKIQIDNQTLF